MDGIGLSPPSDYPGGPHHALGQDVAEPFPEPDLPDELDHGLMVPVDELHAVRIFAVDDPVFVKLVGKGYAIPRADRVYAEVIAELVGPYACFDGRAVDGCR